MAQLSVFIASFAVFLFNPLALLLLWIAISPVVSNFMDKPFLNPFFGSYLLTDAHVKFVSGFSIDELVSFDRIVLILVLAWVACADGIKPVANRLLDYAFLAFLAALLIGCSHSLNPVHALKVVVDSFGLCYVAYLIGKNRLASEDAHRKILTAITVLGALLVAIGLIEFQIHGHLPGYRVTGPFRYWENYGLTLIFAYYVLWYMVNAMEIGFWKRVFFVVLIILVVLCIFLAETRTILVAIIVGTSVIYAKGFKLLNRKSLGIFLIMSFLVVVFLIVSSDIIKSTAFYKERISRQETIHGRVETYKVALEMFRLNPIYGIGIRNYQEKMEEYSGKFEIIYTQVGKTTLHNSYLVVAAETGVIGLVPFLAILYMAYKSVSRLASGGIGNDRLWGLTMLGLTVSYFLCGLAFDPFFESTIDNKLYYLCLGITVGKLSSNEDSADDRIFSY